MPEDLQVGAHRIAVDTSGTGSPVLLLHGSGLSSQQWRRLASKLKATNRVVAPDLIGYGRSDAWTGQGLATYHDDLAVIEAVALREGAPVHVVGHSYGAFLGLLVALRGRVPVASVAVYDPVAFGVLYSAEDKEALNQLQAMDPAVLFAPEMMGTAKWMEWFVDFWNGAGYFARLPEPMRTGMLATGVKTFQEVKSIIEDRTSLSDYAKIRAPTLLLSGERSPLPARHVAKLLSEAIPGARLLTVEGAGHSGPLTHGDVVNAAIVGHISSQTAR